MSKKLKNVERIDVEITDSAIPDKVLAGVGKMRRVCNIGILITMLAILSFPITAQGLSNSGGGNWQYYRSISINNNGGGLTDYQVLVNLTDSDFPALSKSDGSDIRFVDESGAELSYWIESWDYTNKKAKIWVKVTNIQANINTILTMYYGNPAALSASNGSATFVFFDDFEDGTYTGWSLRAGNSILGVSNGWFTVQGTSSLGNVEVTADNSFVSNHAYELKIQTDFENNPSRQGRFMFRSTSPYYGYVVAFYPTNIRLLRQTGSYSETELDGATFYWDDTKVYNMKITGYGNQLNVYINDVLILSASDPDSTYSSGHIEVGNREYYGGTWKFDDTRVRNYVYPEPTVSVGAETVKDVKIAVILAEPSDDSHNTSHNKLYYLTNIIPQLKKYYEEVSYGAVNIIIDPADVYDNNGNWYKLGKTAAYYGKNITKTKPDGTTYQDGWDNSPQFVVDAITASGINYNNYDVIIAVHANQSRQENSSIWELMETHASGKNITVSESELMGTWAHEIGHALGGILQPSKKPYYLPDRYGDSNGNHSIGNWDLMGSGNWLGVPAGSNPNHMSSFSKDWLGWLNNKSVGYGTYWINSLATMNYGDETTRYITENDTKRNYLNYYIIETRANNPAYSRWDTSAPIPYGYNNSLVLYQVADYGEGNSTVDYNKTVDYIKNLIPWGGTPYADYSYWDFASKLRFKALDERARTVGTKPLFEMEVGIDNFSIPWIFGAILEPENNLLGYVPWYSWSSPLNTKTPLPDIDLHAYTLDGKHIGMNYTTGIYENEIPGANASGDLIGREWIFVPDNIKVQFVVDSRDNQNFLNSYPGLQQITNGTQSYNLTLVYDVPNDIRYAASIEQSIQPGDVNKYNYSIARNTDGTYKVIVDDVPPTTTALLSGVMGNNGWYISDVQVNLTAIDNEGGSGVNKTEYSFDSTNWSIYTVPLTISNEGTTTVYYSSTDNAGNVESAKNLTISIDKTPPQITLNTPANEGVYILNQTLIASWSVYDSLSGIASATGTVPDGLAIDTGIVGTKEFNVTAIDNASNTASQNVFYTITYNYLGILPPIRADNSSIFKSGSTVPVKFRIVDANGNNVSTAVANLTYQKFTDDILGTIEEPYSTGAADSGNTFRYDSTNNLYIFNLDTSSMGKGTYQLNINLDDGTVYTVDISIKP